MFLLQSLQTLLWLKITPLDHELHQFVQEHSDVSAIKLVNISDVLLLVV